MPITSAANVIINAPNRDWSSADEQKLAQQACVDAFFLDLKIVCAGRPVVLLMDAWERCNSELQKWIMRELLKPHCFDLDGRPERLVFVIAGREVPNFKAMLGADRYEFLVRSLSSLGEWDERHVKEFLEVHGYKEIEDGDVKYVCEKLKSGWSLQKALKMVEEFVLGK
jgi:hypothetical protein